MVLISLRFLAHTWERKAFSGGFAETMNNVKNVVVVGSAIAALAATMTATSFEQPSLFAYPHTHTQAEKCNAYTNRRTVFELNIIFNELLVQTHSHK